MHMASEESSGATLSALLSARAESHASAPAILSPGRPPLTYAALWRQARRIASVIAAHASETPPRVAVVLPNGPELATACLGVAACSACVPLHERSSEAELRMYLQDARAQFAVFLSSERGPIRDVALDMDLQALEVEWDPALPAGELHIRSSRPAGTATQRRIEADDVALVLHTSGTTGQPKIVPLTHRNLLASARAIAEHLALTPADRCLNVMPLFHIHGLVGALLASIEAGASIVCTPGFDERMFFQWIAAFDPTWYSAVPTIHQSVVANGAAYRATASGHRFRFVRSCSSALPAKTLHALEALTCAPVVEAYGMTEASHEMASNPLSGARKPETVGIPTGAEIAIMNTAGELLDKRATGEIVIRGAGVMRGYEHDAAANDAAFSNGWFRTGDEGHFDADGYLHITGRLKEVIKRGGETIAPREIDTAVLEHPDVAQAIAFAIPHPTLGQDVAVAVVLRRGARVTETELRRFVLGRLSAAKVPSCVVFLDEIPKEATGKVQRTSLYEKLRSSIVRTGRAAGTDLERSLEAIFRNVLGCERISIDDNFFALGGDSLKAAQLVARILAQHDVELAIPAVFAHATIAELAVLVEAARSAQERRRDELASEIDRMSDEEVERLLAEREAGEGAAKWTRR